MAPPPRRLDARRHPGHPAQGGARPVPLPRHVDTAAGAELRRPDVPPVHAVARAARGLPRALRDGDGARHALRRAAAAPEDPDHRLRHVVRRAVTQRQGRHRPRREPRGHVDHDRRRRHAPDGAGQLRPPDLPDLPEPLRQRRARHGERRRGRDRGRPGRQAGHRRRAAGREGVRRGGAHARPAAGRRPALAGPPSRLHRTGRPAPQDRADPRGDRRPDPGLRQDRRRPRRATTSSWRPRPAPT